MTFSSNGWIPCSLTWCPRKSSSETPRIHFARLMTMPWSQYLSHMSFVLFQGRAGNEEVVNVSIAEGEAA